MATTTTPDSCHVCGNETHQVCSRCSDGLDKLGNPTSTFYCSKDCQASDFKQHKETTCKFANACKQLYRGASLVQEAFYRFREATFDYKITSVNTSNDGKIHLGIKRNVDTVWPIHPVPEQLASQPKKKQALLCWRVELCRCEVAVHIKDFEKRIAIIGHHEDGTSDERKFEHVVVQINLIDENRYIIDLTGAQYGQNTTVMLASEYEKEYVVRTVASKPLGTWWLFWSNIANDVNTGIVQDPRLPTNFDTCVLKMTQCSARVIKAGLEGWDRDASLSVTAMLKGKKAVFESGKMHLLLGLSEEVAYYMCKTKSAGSRIGMVITALGGVAQSTTAWIPLRTADLNENETVVAEIGSWSNVGTLRLRKHIDNFAKADQSGKSGT